MASLLVPTLRAAEDLAATRRTAVALLAGSPRVMVAGPGLCRADARGWGRRGGEGALAEELLAAVGEAGIGGAAAAGVADVAVAADAAALLASGSEGADGAARPEPAAPLCGRSGRELPALRVPPGESRSFLGPLPLRFLPLPDGMRETLRAAGLRRVGELAARSRVELESRFGPPGVRAWRWARGEDERLFRPLSPETPPEVRLELETPARSTEPLLFTLRHLLHRLCGELAEEGRCVRRLRLRRELEDGGVWETEVAPARPTRREGLLLDLCRAALERAAEEGRLPAPVRALALVAEERAAAGVRQGDLFRERSRDPVEAAGTLSRLRARLGEEGVVRPAPRAHHRPETRNAWRPVSPEAVAEGEGGPGRSGEADVPGGSGFSEETGSPQEPASPGRRSAVPGVLRLLPEPRPVRVECSGEGPGVLWLGGERREVVAAEGPERLSGDWWRAAPFRREYYRVCTGEGELYWIFREGEEGGGWWLHGWWD